MPGGQGLQPGHQLGVSTKVQRGVDPPFLGLQSQHFKILGLVPAQRLRRDIGQRRAAP